MSIVMSHNDQPEYGMINFIGRRSMMEINKQSQMYLFASAQCKKPRQIHLELLN